MALSIFRKKSYFGPRGREGVRSLKPSPLKIAPDSDGHPYVAMAYNIAAKIH